MIKHLQDFFETSNTISTIWLGILILIDSLAILTVLISVIMFHGAIPNLIQVYFRMSVYGVTVIAPFHLLYEHKLQKRI